MKVLLLFIPLLFLVGCQNKSAYDPHYIMSDAAEELATPPAPSDD